MHEVIEIASATEETGRTHTVFMREGGELEGNFVVWCSCDKYTNNIASLNPVVAEDAGKRHIERVLQCV